MRVPFPKYFAVLLLSAGVSLGQTDPGPRPGAAGAGGFFPTLTANEQLFFTQAKVRFKHITDVPDGMGPGYNGDSCNMCHSQPATGGSSPGMNSPQNPVPNPQIAVATLNGAKNYVPSFITAKGPVREARFIGTSTQVGAPLDGGVHNLFSIAGRKDAPGCSLGQPPFKPNLAAANVSLRIPTPLFGLGLVENTPEATLRDNLAANQSQKTALGIAGRFNTSGNDGTITRFGWKAQNKSLLVFAGEAYNVEMGITNEVFPDERNAVTGCIFNATPEDSTKLTHNGSTTGTASEMSSDVNNFAAFMRLLAAPTPTTASSSELNGQALFTSVGCVLCHSDSLTTAASIFNGLSNVTYAPLSDFALHHMGATLADGVYQGNATADEFRTAPLWGLGQRLFFLHDGRTTDLVQAIGYHASSNRDCMTSQTSASFLANLLQYLPTDVVQFCGSEANAVINNFNGLNSSDQQDLLNFLRSL